jgi:choline-sulfatase
MLSVVQAGTCLTSNQLDFDEEVAFQAVRKLHDLARNAGDGSRPFCLVVSFTHPHDPYAITQEYWDRYDDAKIPPPAVPPIPVEQMDPHSRRVHHVCDLGRYRQSEERVRAARHAYYAAISYVDDKVGQLLKALRSTCLGRDTIVLLTSDHGDMVGERGLWYKMVFFEWAATVPLLVHCPSRFAPRRVANHVSGLDILPTLVELASAKGAAFPLAEPVDGSSLVPFLEGREPGRPNAVVAEMLFEGAVAPCFMIRSGRYKYVYSQPDPEQLYDLAADPHELVNLAGRPDYELLLAQFRSQLGERWDVARIHRAVLASQRRRRLVDRALTKGTMTPWDFQPYRDSSKQYMRNSMELDDLERRARFPAPPTPEADG